MSLMLLLLAGWAVAAAYSYLSKDLQKLKGPGILPQKHLAIAWAEES